MRPPRGSRVPCVATDDVGRGDERAGCGPAELEGDRARDAGPSSGSVSRTTGTGLVDVAGPPPAPGADGRSDWQPTRHRQAAVAPSTARRRTVR